MSAAIETPAITAVSAKPADLCFMRAALAHSCGALGTTAPNPCVGALVVREGAVIGRGITQPGGRPHAEAIALAEAGASARGATLYVTLEPCAARSDRRFGPSCTEAIIAAGIARVVVAADDPSPFADGRAFVQMAAAGIAVTRGVCAEEARRIHLGHIRRLCARRPMVTLKLAETADGFAAASSGDRLMITGEAANRRVQEMRAHHDAIMVGIGTVLADDPRLNVRLDRLPPRHPVRVVLDTRLRLPPRSRLARCAATAPLWVIAGAGARNGREAILQAAGVTVIRVDRDLGGRLDLRASLAALADRGLTRVFSEGGPTVASALLVDDLVDEVAIFTSPRRLSRQGIPTLASAARGRLDDPGIFRRAFEASVGPDRLVVFERQT